MFQIFQKFHRQNALFLGVFILLHMATHLSGLWGIEAYNSTQDLMRQIYRFPPVEILLFASISLQAVAGAYLLRTTWRRGMRSFWGKIQLISGLIVIVFLVQHLPAFALARWMDGMDTNFFWPAAVMHSAPLNWYFTPYYFLAVLALFVHLGCALRLICLRQGQRARAATAFWSAAATGVLLGALICAMLLGWFYDITLPEEWQLYLQKYSFGLAN